jgi:hypothetical protein
MHLSLLHFTSFFYPGSNNNLALRMSQPVFPGEYEYYFRFSSPLGLLPFLPDFSTFFFHSTLHISSYTLSLSSRLL